MSANLPDPDNVGNLPCSRIEISLECKNLRNADWLSKSDPMIVLYMKTHKSKDFYQIGRTETIQNSLNPAFHSKFILDYFFEEQQWLKFEVYDIDSKSTNLKDHDFLGSAECTMADIVSNLTLTKILDKTSTKDSQIIVTSEEISTCKDEITMQFKALNLEGRGWCWQQCCPYLRISRSREDGKYVLVHKTEYKSNTINPIWNTFKITSQKLCNGDYFRALKFDCYDWHSDESGDSTNSPGETDKHRLIGSFQTNADELSKAREKEINYDLINPKSKLKKKNYMNSGILNVLSFEIQKLYTFVDFIKAGTQLHCTFAIDFTSSNGDPRSPNSLHYMQPNHMNQYEIAITSVGEIIQDYDSDKLFPVLGFGAKIPVSGAVSHEFFVNMDLNNPYCQGMDGVLQAYRNCIPQIQLYGPTNFSPVINHVAKFASSAQGGANYFILLIITDGIITDMALTKEAIVNASILPMSIIIIGVGDAEFDAMEELDGDAVRISSRGRTAVRDIVQFVPLRDFNKGTGSLFDDQMMKYRLAKEVLAEIPDQFLSYMSMNRISPKSLR